MVCFGIMAFAESRGFRRIEFDGRTVQNAKTRQKREALMMDELSKLASGLQLAWF